MVILNVAQYLVTGQRSSKTLPPWRSDLKRTFYDSLQFPWEKELKFLCPTIRASQLSIIFKAQIFCVLSVPFLNSLSTFILLKMIISQLTISHLKLFKVSKTRGTILFGEYYLKSDQVNSGLKHRVGLVKQTSWFLTWLLGSSYS